MLVELSGPPPREPAPASCRGTAPVVGCSRRCSTRWSTCRGSTSASTPATLVPRRSTSTTGSSRSAGPRGPGEGWLLGRRLAPLTVRPAPVATDGTHRTSVPSPFHNRQDLVTTWQPSPTLRHGPGSASARCHASSTAATRCARRRGPRSTRPWRRWATARRDPLLAVSARRQGFVGVLVPYFDEPSSYQRLRGIVRARAAARPRDRAVQRRRPRSGPQPPGGSSTAPARRSDHHLAPAAIRRRRPAGPGAVPDRVGGHVAPGVAERRHRRPQRRPDRHRVPAVAGPRAHRVHRRAGAQPVRLRVEPQPRGRLRRCARRRRHRARPPLHEVRPPRPHRGAPARRRAVRHAGATDGGGRRLRHPGVRRHRRRSARRQRRATRRLGHRLRRHRSRRLQRLDHGASAARGVRSAGLGDPDRGPGDRDQAHPVRRGAGGRTGRAGDDGTSARGERRPRRRIVS